MDFELDDYPKNDSMKTLRKCCIDIFQYEVVKYIYLWALNVTIFDSVLEVKYYLKVFESDIFLTYAPAFFILQFVIVSILKIFFINGVGPRTLKNLTLWKITIDNQNLIKQIKDDSRNASLFVIMSLFFGIFSGFVFSFPSENNNNLFYLSVWVDDFVLPQWKFVFSWLLCLAIMFITFTCVALLYEFIYTVIHGNSQIRMLLAYIKTLNDLEEGKTDIELIRDINFQQNINKKLKRIIQRQGQLKRLCRVLTEQIKPFIFLYALTGGLFVISIMFLLIRSKGNEVTTYLRFVPMTVLGFWVFAGLISCGQRAEDLSEFVLNEIYFLNWYKWNEENKKMYLIMLMNSLNGVRVKLSPNVAVNNKLGFSIVKAVYSIVSVLKSFV